MTPSDPRYNPRLHITRAGELENSDHKGGDNMFYPLGEMMEESLEQKIKHSGGRAVANLFSYTKHADGVVRINVDPDDPLIFNNPNFRDECADILGGITNPTRKEVGNQHNPDPAKRTVISDKVRASFPKTDFTNIFTMGTGGIVTLVDRKGRKRDYVAINDASKEVNPDLGNVPSGLVSNGNPLEDAGKEIFEEMGVLDVSDPTKVVWLRFILPEKIDMSAEQKQELQEKREQQKALSIGENSYLRKQLLKHHPHLAHLPIEDRDVQLKFVKSAVTTPIEITTPAGTVEMDTAHLYVDRQTMSINIHHVLEADIDADFDDIIVLDPEPFGREVRLITPEEGVRMALNGGMIPAPTDYHLRNNPDLTIKLANEMILAKRNAENFAKAEAKAKAKMAEQNQSAKQEFGENKLSGSSSSLVQRAPALRV